MSKKIINLILGFMLIGGLQAQNIVTQDTFYVQIDECNQFGQICIDVPLNEFNDYALFQNGVDFDNPIMGCDIDTLLVYTYTTLFGQGESGPYTITQWVINGDTITGSFNDIPELVQFMNDSDPSATWTADTTSLFITGGDPSNTYSDLLVMADVNNSMSLIGLNLGLDAQGTTLFIEKGRHEMVMVDENTGFRDTFLIEVSCLETHMFEETLVIGATDSICLDFEELFADVVSIENLCAENLGGALSITLSEATNCVVFTALEVGMETACFVACDELGYCDTTIIELEAIVPDINVDVYLDTIPLTDEAYIVCLDTTELPGIVDTIYNFCEDDEGAVSFAFVDGELCLKYTGVEIGKDSACVVICDDLNYCDTTYVCISVIDTTTMSSEIIHITIPINFEDTYCVDTTELNGTIVDIINDCPESSGDFVVFEIDEANYCIDFTGIDIGEDTACILLLDDLGNIDTTMIIVTVLPPQDMEVFDTIILDESGFYCIDTSELAGQITSIQNVCEDSSGDIVNFGINNVTLCIEYSGLALGTEQACIVICDDLGVCDLTILNVTVIEAGEDSPPTAVDDTASIPINGSVTIDILANDIIPGQLDSIYIWTEDMGGIEPSNGTAILQPDGSMIYVPNIDFCGLDTAAYIICNAIGCDTAQVIIDVDCFFVEPGEFIIFNGMSPNGDGINDNFFIKGIEFLPNHILNLYSRWGNLLLNTTSYRNGWDGTFEGKDLPDGTYFYVFEPGNGEIYKGWFYLRR